MVKSEKTNVNIRMDKELKEQADLLFAQLGINMTTAINMFVSQAVRQGKIPFELSLTSPNAETLAAIQEVADMESGKIQTKSYSNFSELLKEVTAIV